MEIEEDLILIEDDITALSVGLTEVDENLDFLFDEQVIQDERLLNLEETSDGIIGELDSIEDELESECLSFLLCDGMNLMEFLSWLNKLKTKLVRINQALF